MSNNNDKEMADSLKELNDMMGDIQGTIDKVTSELTNTKHSLFNQKQMDKLQNEIGNIHDWSKSGGITNPDKEVQEEEAFTPDSTTEEEEFEGRMKTNAESILYTMFDIIEATPNNMELGKRIRTMYHDLVTMSEEEATPDSLEKVANTMKDKPTYSYESPDGGDTVYKREHGTDERELVKTPSDNPNQLELF